MALVNEKFFKLRIWHSKRLQGIQTGCSLGTDAERTGGRLGRGGKKKGLLCVAEIHTPESTHTQTDRRGV